MAAEYYTYSPHTHHWMNLSLVVIMTMIESVLH